VVSGVVCGIQMLIHDRLRRQAVEELPDLMDELLHWGLSYQRPRVPLRRVSRKIEIRDQERSTDPVERLLVAFAELAAAKGFRAVSVNDLAPRAATSMRTLYANFGGKDEAFLACVEMGRERMRVAVRPAYAEAEDWSRAVAAGNEALLDFLASEPAIARASIVEVLAAGPTALEQRDLAIKTYAERLREGFELTPEVPTVATEAISFGRYALLERHIVRYGPQALPRLGPALTFFVLAPFLGSDRAALVANESVRRAPGSPDIGGRRQLDLIRRPTIGPFEAHRIAHD
jgi:AcrR family transcriptional regulator